MKTAEVVTKPATAASNSAKHGVKCRSASRCRARLVPGQFEGTLRALADSPRKGETLRAGVRLKASHPRQHPLEDVRARVSGAYDLSRARPSKEAGVVSLCADPAALTNCRRLLVLD